MSESQLDGDTEDQRQMDVAADREMYLEWLRERHAALHAERQPWAIRLEAGNQQVRCALREIARITTIMDSVLDSIHSLEKGHGPRP